MVHGFVMHAVSETVLEGRSLIRLVRGGGRWCIRGGDNRCMIDDDDDDDGM